MIHRAIRFTFRLNSLLLVSIVCRDITSLTLSISSQGTVADSSYVFGHIRSSPTRSTTSNSVGAVGVPHIINKNMSAPLHHAVCSHSISSLIFTSKSGQAAHQDTQSGISSAERSRSKLLVLNTLPDQGRYQSVMSEEGNESCITHAGNGGLFVQAGSQGAKFLKLLKGITAFSSSVISLPLSFSGSG